MADLETSIEGAVALARFNRPEVRNALTIAMMEDLSQHVARYATSEEVSALILTGDGDAFTSGVDLAEIERDPQRSAAAFLGLIRALAQFQKPLVVAAKGSVVGGGMLIAGLADMRFVQPGGIFALPEIKMGVPPFLGLAIWRDMLPDDAFVRLIYAAEKLRTAELAAWNIISLSDDPEKAALDQAANFSLYKMNALAALKSYDRAGRNAAIDAAITASQNYMKEHMQ